mmetsp:Transcript_109538/g.294685  ORF Transcript_109538/g.294685 Transcript_109538/m.294685 type:complete len:202 (-) Transcript_109538:1602-2207(-)
MRELFFNFIVQELTLFQLSKMLPSAMSPLMHTSMPAWPKSQPRDFPFASLCVLSHVGSDSRDMSRAPLNSWALCGTWAGVRKSSMLPLMRFANSFNTASGGPHTLFTRRNRAPSMTLPRVLLSSYASCCSFHSFKTPPFLIPVMVQMSSLPSSNSRPKPSGVALPPIGRRRLIALLAGSLTQGVSVMLNCRFPVTFCLAAN